MAKKTKQKTNKNVKRAFVLLFSIFIMGLSSGMFILYGPYSWVRDRLITTAMTTMTHQYLATWFFNDETIAEVLANNKVVEPDEDTNPNEINIGGDTSSTKYASKYEKDILEHDKDATYKIINVSGLKYKGYLIAIYDPSKVKIATAKKLGVSGQYLTTLAKENNAVVAMNAGGFYDPTWTSNGSTPHGTVIKDSKIIWDYEDARVGGGFVGFTEDDVLVLGRMSASQALNKYKMRDAIEFGPFLVVNGKASFVGGDGGWGIAPRTAIGQRKDGIVLFLVIDGRQPGYSIGADMNDLSDVMVKYGAYNAANMDGGSSSALVVKNKIYNKPCCAKGQDGLRGIPTAWIVEE